MDPKMFVQKIFSREVFLMKRFSFHGSPNFYPFCKLSEGEDKISQA
jgi:hypothetical protein